MYLILSKILIFKYVYKFHMLPIREVITICKLIRSIKILCRRYRLLACKSACTVAFISGLKCFKILFYKMKWMMLLRVDICNTKYFIWSAYILVSKEHFRRDCFCAPKLLNCIILGCRIGWLGVKCSAWAPGISVNRLQYIEIFYNERRQNFNYLLR